MQISDLTVPYNPANGLDWNNDGVVILKNFIPEDLMQEYETCWVQNNGQGDRENFTMVRPGGWDYATPYRKHPELLNILSYKPLHDEMAKLIKEPAGLHLNLTGWVSTTRNWHQDTYLNPDHVGDYYVAAWIALEDIDPDSGPFQYIAGSHKWYTVTRDKIMEALTPEERTPKWPTHSERLLTPLFEQEIKDRNAEVTTHLPQRGDVLLWHSRLLHRGSIANTPGLMRKSLIAHYSGINHRQDMPPAIPYDGGWYFPVDDGLRSMA